MPAIDDVTEKGGDEKRKRELFRYVRKTSKEKQENFPRDSTPGAVEREENKSLS